MTQIVGNFLVIISAVLCWTFVALYHVLSRGGWRRSLIGRHLMVSDATVGAVLTLTAVRVVAGAGLETPWFAVLRTVMFAAVPVVVAWRIWLMVRTLLKHRDEEGER